MALNFKKIWNGLKLVKKAASTSDSSGDLEVVTIAGKDKLHYYNAGEATANSPIVTEAHSATFTNKTIDAASNTISNISNSNLSASAAIDVSKIADGSVSNSEFQFLNSVTSNVQTQIDSKQATITGAATTITSSNLTASKVVVSDVTGKVSASSVSATTLDYLDATSSVQTQLDAKVDEVGGTFTSGSVITPARSDVKQGTKSSLDTYAATASNGQLVFATDDKQMYQVVDGVLVAVGGADTVKLLSGDTLSVGDAVYISTGTGNDSARVAGILYKADASNDDRVDVLGFVKKLYSGSGATFTEGFESGNFTTNSWNTVNGSQTNKWAVGTATAQTGSYSAYISNDSGVSNAYTVTSTSVVWFYKDITVTSAQMLSFYYKLNGESIFDYGRVIIDPSASIVPVAGTNITSTPSGGQNIQLTSTSNSWTQKIVPLNSYAGTTVRVIFGWVNDFGGGTQPPIAIDNITIQGSPSADVQFSGSFASLSGLTAGNLYYLSTSTPGALTATAPSLAGTWIVPVGLSTSGTSLVINPAASASAIYNTAADTSFTIANNISSATSVTGLSFSGSTYRSFIIDYSIYRSTSTALSAVAQVGELRGVYNTQSLTWYLSDNYSGQNSGVTFSITSGGQIQYTSTNISGTSYTGSLKYTTRKTFGV